MKPDHIVVSTYHDSKRSSVHNDVEDVTENPNNKRPASSAVKYQQGYQDNGRKEGDLKGEHEGHLFLNRPKKKEKK